MSGTCIQSSRLFAFSINPFFQSGFGRRNAVATDLRHKVVVDHTIPQIHALGLGKLENIGTILFHHLHEVRVLRPQNLFHFLT